MSLDDLPSIRELPLKVIEKVNAAFRDVISIDYVGDSDLIWARIKMGNKIIILELEPDLEVPSADISYLIKSVWDGQHDILADELKSFFEFGRDIGRLTLLEIKLSGLFMTISVSYDEVSAARALGDEVPLTHDESPADQPLAEPWGLEESCGEASKSADVAAELMRDPELAVRVQATFVPYALGSEPAHPISAPAPLPAAKPDRVLRTNHPARIIIGFLLGGAASGVVAGKYWWSNDPSTSSAPRPVAPNSAPVAPIRREGAVPIAPVTNTGPACPSYSLTVTTEEHHILPVLRRMQTDWRQIFANYHLTPVALVTQTIRPRHIAEAAARDPNDRRHTLGEEAHYHFGLMRAGDRFTLQTCPTQAPVFTHSRQGVTLYSFSLR